MYLRSHSIDGEGRAGPEGELKIYSEQAVGNYQVKVIVTSCGKSLSGAIAKMGEKEATTGRYGVATIYIDHGVYSLNVWSDEKFFFDLIPKYGVYSEFGIKVQDDMEIEVDLINIFNLIIAILVFAIFLVAALLFPIPGGPYGKLLMIVLGVIAAAVIYFFL